MIIFSRVTYSNKFYEIKFCEAKFFATTNIFEKKFAFFFMVINNIKDIRETKLIN